MEFTVKLSNDLKRNLDGVSKLVGKSSSEIVINLLRSYLSDFCNGDGKFSPKEADLLESDYERQYRVNCGDKDIGRLVVGSCVVLDKADMMGSPFYKIYYDGRMIKVPENLVVFK